MSTLWERKNYLIDAPYIIAHNIYEYDIQKANINILFALGIIDREYYDKLYNMSRMDRQVEIGYMIKYTEGLGDKLSEGIKLYRKKMFEANGLEDENILSIKNDAIFVIDKKLKITEFDNVKFILKNRYSTYIKLNRSIEVYFESNIVDGTISLDIKGISDEKLELHHKYIATVVADVLYFIETGDINSGLTYIGELYNSYVERKLQPGYYRNFNAESDFTINANGMTYSIPCCLDYQTLMTLDISYNLNIIRELYGYLTNIYFQRTK